MNSKDFTSYIFPASDIPKTMDGVSPTTAAASNALKRPNDQDSEHLKDSAVSSPVSTPQSTADADAGTAPMAKKARVDQDHNDESMSVDESAANDAETSDVTMAQSQGKAIHLLSWTRTTDILLPSSGTNFRNIFFLLRRKERAGRGTKGPSNRTNIITVKGPGARQAICKRSSR